MQRDRIIQIAALCVAILAALGAGALLPTILAKSGQEFIVVQPIASDSFDIDASADPVEVFTSMIRSLEELAQTGDPDEPLSIPFDAGTKSWDGHLGDTVAISWRDGTMLQELRGRIEAIDGYALRYTDVSIDGAPPIVALGTAIGALRGIIVDYLWIKVNMMKEKGQFYEVMSDADLITKLQPRYPDVWAFHGHNMMYNISVLTNTREERWDWVQQGLNLVRNEGLRYNPNDVVLHKELAFWFAHKIDGVADDAHLYYKREFAKKWHLLLGEVPYDVNDRVTWMEELANAPETLERAEQVAPGIKALVESLKAELDEFDAAAKFKWDQEFLVNLGQWLAVKTSPYARVLGLDRQFGQTSPLYIALDRTIGKGLSGTPEERKAAVTLIQMLRKKVLREDFNMDPEIMFEFTRDFGPLDWRHPQAHAFYWGRLGTERGAKRYESRMDVHKVLNNDRITIQAMQALARSGMMTVDPFSGANPGRLADPRWIRSIDQYFRGLYDKHYGGRGGGVDSFTHFHENFMKQAVREFWRAGEYDDAKDVYEYLNSLYGEGGVVPHAGYTVPLEQFVEEVTKGEYEMQPEVARSDVYAALRRGFREGLLLDRPEVLEQALEFARDLTEYFQKNEYNNFVNKFGEGRMSDLIGNLRDSVENVFAGILLDQSMALLDRIVIYRRAPEAQQRMVYDRVIEALRGEYEGSELLSVGAFEDAFPEPPEMEAYRAALGKRAGPSSENTATVEQK